MAGDTPDTPWQHGDAEGSEPGEAEASQRSPALAGRWWLLAALLVVAVALPAIGRAQEGQPNRAGLVIRHGDGRVVTACVSFAEPEISGTDLLQRAGVSYQAQKISIGAAVCKLDGEGCDYPAEDCFCKCKGAECVYWIYHHLRDSQWVYAQISASRWKIRPGDVDGWAWGAGNNQAGAQPPPLSFQEVCPDPASAGAAPSPTVPPPTVPPPTATVPPAPAKPTPTRPRPTAAQPATPVASATAEPASPTTTLAALPTATTGVSAATPTAASAPATVRQPTAPPRAAAPPATSGAAGGASAPSNAPPERGAARSWTGYLAFGALVFLLGAAIVGALLRRRGRPPS